MHEETGAREPKECKGVAVCSHRDGTRVLALQYAIMILIQAHANIVGGNSGGILTAATSQRRCPRLLVSSDSTWQKKEGKAFWGGVNIITHEVESSRLAGFLLACLAFGYVFPATRTSAVHRCTVDCSSYRFFLLLVL